MEILLHFLSFLWWKVFKKSKIAQIYYYDPQSAGINLQSPQKWFNSFDTNSNECTYSYKENTGKIVTTYILFINLIFSLGFFI